MAAPPPAPAPAAPPAGAPAAPPAAAPAPPPAAPVPCPYTSEPGFVVFKLPTKSNPSEAQTITIRNPTGVRATYKVGGTQVKRFIVVPQYGFIEGMGNSPAIELQPKKIDKGALVSYQDKFLIEIAPAPAEGADAEAIWKAGTAVQNPAILAVDIKIVAD